MTNRLLIAVGMILFIALITVMFMQIFSRFVLNMNVPWTEELSRILFIHFCFLSTAIAFIKREMIIIDTIITKIPQAIRKYIDFFIEVFCTLFFLVLFVGSIKMMISVWPTRFSTMENLSTGWLYVAPIYSSLIILCNQIFRFASSIKNHQIKK